MTVPIWFLDIDGVINSFGTPLPGTGVDPNAYEEIKVSVTGGTTWPIVYSHTVVDFINEVSRSGLVEVRWLTTWQQEARLALAPAVGLDKFPAYDELFDPDFPWWKEKVVRDALAETDAPFIWTDDDLERPVRESIMHAFPRECLMIQPSSNPGLNDDHLADICQFVGRFGEWKTALPITQSQQAIVGSVRLTRGVAGEEH